MAGAESTLDFTLVNKTGYGIKAIHVAPSSSKDWGENIIDEVLAHGGAVDVEFHPKADSVKKWDVLVSWEDEGYPDVYWTGYELATINKITLRYNRKTDRRARRPSRDRPSDRVDNAPPWRLAPASAGSRPWRSTSWRCWRRRCPPALLSGDPDRCRPPAPHPVRWWRT
jgi:hypothetical protein